MNKTCKDCDNFIGYGDWNLCCKEHHEGYPFGFLCYEDTPACEKYKPIVQLNEEDFIDTYCSYCGSQRCEGIGTPWFEGCGHKYRLVKE